MRRWQRCLIGLGLVLSGCGKGGHHPEFFPEVRFVIEPLGGQTGTTFQVEYIADGDATHHFQPGRIFNATEPVGFFLDNAAPPYGASFLWVDGAQADIVLIVSGKTVQISPERLGPSNDGPVELTSVNTDGGSFGVGPGQPEVRLEISSDPGTLFEGTIGDFFTSYDIGFTVDDDVTLVQRAPAYIFFENPRETISAVVRAGSHLDITIDLYVNGDLVASDTSSKDAIVNRDL